MKQSRRSSQSGLLKAVAAGALLMLNACAGHTGPPPSTDIDETAFRDHLRILASDDFGGRRPGTAGEEKTVAYLVEQFRKLGFKPGNGDSYLQPVALLEITAVDTFLKIGGRNLAYKKDMLIWSKRAVPEVRLASSELVFVGYGIVAPEFGWNDYADIDVHGKTVVVLVNDPGYASKDPQLFKGNAMSEYGRWSYKLDEATRQGAAGVLLIHDPQAAGYGWNVVQSTWSGAQLQRTAPDGNAGRPAIEGWLQHDAAAELFAATGRDLAALTAAASQRGFKAVELRLKVDAALQNSLRAFTSSNVIALLPGGSRHGEYVMYTAHWDHFGSDTARAGHSIFNGALDNASGLAGLLVLAQSFHRTVPVDDRSILFLATTAGEPDLLGSAYYIDNPTFPLRETAAVMNLDTLMTGGHTRDLSVFGFGNTDLEDVARAAALLQGREAHPEPNPERGTYYLSDSYNFARAGVPVLYVQSGIDNSARGPAFGRAQIDDYLAHRYRQPSDQYSPDWDVRGMLDDLALYYDVGDRVARSRRFPRWYPNSEFRASRSRSAPGPHAN